MTDGIEVLARRIESAFVAADLDADGEPLGFRHLALLAAVVVAEHGLVAV